MKTVKYLALMVLYTIGVFAFPIATMLIALALTDANIDYAFPGFLVGVVGSIWCIVRFGLVRDDLLN